ncbi:hypothetical protein EON65_47310 [archaeon]|nr:MAG: hypothetical protein EON65_47310 [archaeon]
MIVLYSLSTHATDLIYTDKDPRRKFALEEPRPNVSFCLFQASATSPALCVLTDIKNVEKDMMRLSRQYFLETVKFDTAHRTIVLPELLRVYWADFGKKQSDVLKYITSISGSQFATRIKEYVNTLDTGAIKTSFMGFDWTPMFILNDK